MFIFCYDLVREGGDARGSSLSEAVGVLEKVEVLGCLDARALCRLARAAAGLRAAVLNARIGFAEVRNHLSTPKLLALMQTDVFRYHGYTEVEIDGRWHKLTPAFNRELCERFGVRPLDWDGNGDALFHEFDLAGEQHMEYLADHGPREDLPFEEMMNAYRRHYPGLFEAAARGRAAPDDAFRTPANH